MIKKCALFCLLALSVFLTACASTFPRAKVTFKVVNQDGEPVRNVPVQLGFFGGKGIRGTTDENGCFTGEGETYSDYLFGVGLLENGSPNKKYYTTWYQKKIADWKNPPEDGKWKPWNETINLVVKEKINPIAMYATQDIKFKSKIPKLNEWVGYDFEQNDWISPYGEGKVIDIECCLSVEYYNEEHFKNILKLRFPYPKAGACFMKKDMYSNLESVYQANPHGKYQNEISFVSETKYKGMILSILQKKSTLLIDDDYLIFRTRTKVDKDGNLIEARYGKIYDLSFVVVKNKSKLGEKTHVRMSYYLNPNINDINLECDPSKSLCPGKTHISKP